MAENISKTEGNDPMNEAMRIAGITVDAMHSQTKVTSLLSWVMIVNLFVSLVSMATLTAVCIVLLNGAIK